MRESEFKAVDDLAEVCDGAITRIMASELLVDVRKKLQEMMSKLPENYSVNFDFNLNVFDSDREMSIPLIRRGITGRPAGAPYESSGDTSVHRYMVDGQISMVPSDFCPNCWGEWDLKHQNKTCFNCDYQMGVEVKLLLDSDVCPACEAGKVGRTNPTCDKCGETVDPNDVIWG